MSNVFIIGNGFDLDIGLKSKFDDFYDSDYWPFHGKNTPLAKFLELNCAIERWLDLEEALAEYGSKTISFGSHAIEDKEWPPSCFLLSLITVFSVTYTLLISRIFLIWQKRNCTS